MITRDVAGLEIIFPTLSRIDVILSAESWVIWRDIHSKISQSTAHNRTLWF